MRGYLAWVRGCAFARFKRRVSFCQPNITRRLPKISRFRRRSRIIRLLRGLHAWYQKFIRKRPNISKFPRRKSRLLEGLHDFRSSSEDFRRLRSPPSRRTNKTSPRVTWFPKIIRKCSSEETRWLLRKIPDHDQKVSQGTFKLLTYSNNSRAAIIDVFSGDIPNHLSIDHLQKTR